MRSYLYHDGIKGMKWGQRRYQNADGTYTELGKKRRQKQMDKLAKKDAQEYARAKMFYGEGAGNRRKLIKATVNERSKDEYYKQAFDKYFSQQDMAKHAEKATSFALLSFAHADICSLVVFIILPPLCIFAECK